MNRPNIIYLHSHDTGRYVQPYGHVVPTPNIQRLAEEGVLFRQCFCAAPTCSPSRASLLTGQYAHSAGLEGLVNRGWTLPDGSHHIVQTLGKAGYRSALIGMTHVLKDRNALGYDEIVPVQSAQAKHVAPAAAEWLQQHGAEGPFFLTVGFSETHRPYPEPGPAEDARYCRPPDPFPDTPETRQDMAAFKTTARLMDDGIGVVLDALDTAGLTGNTLVINTTDHGLAFPAMKCNLTDHGIGVMLVMRGPGGFTGGKVVDGMVSQIDLFPTVCDLAGIEQPAWLQGTSILPLVRGEADSIRDEVFAEVNYHASYEPMRAVRTRRWKYIRRFDDRTTPVLPNCDDSPSKTFWLEHGWRERPFAVEQLYDLVFDPYETNDLAAAPRAAAALAEMRGRLDRWMHETDDPLLKGPLSAPEGAIVNEVDGLSPNEPTRPAV